MRYLGFGIGHLNPADFPHEAYQLPTVEDSAAASEQTESARQPGLPALDEAEEDEGGEDGSDVSTEEDWEGDEWLNEANDEDGEI